jgi:hypothetical protein
VPTASMRRLDIGEYYCVPTNCNGLGTRKDVTRSGQAHGARCSGVNGQPPQLDVASHPVHDL